MQQWASLEEASLAWHVHRCVLQHIALLSLQETHSASGQLAVPYTCIIEHGVAATCVDGG
jgi:hypothetical protein